MKDMDQEDIRQHGRLMISQDLILCSRAQESPERMTWKCGASMLSCQQPLAAKIGRRAWSSRGCVSCETPAALTRGAAACLRATSAFSHSNHACTHSRYRY